MLLTAEKQLLLSSVKQTRLFKISKTQTINQGGLDTFVFILHKSKHPKQQEREEEEEEEVEAEAEEEAEPSASLQQGNHWKKRRRTQQQQQQGSNNKE